MDCLGVSDSINLIVDYVDWNLIRGNIRTVQIALSRARFIKRDLTVIILCRNTRYRKKKWHSEETIINSSIFFINAWRDCITLHLRQRKIIALTRAINYHEFQSKSLIRMIKDNRLTTFIYQMKHHSSLGGGGRRAPLFANLKPFFLLVSSF